MIARLKKLGFLGIFGIAMFSLGGVYVGLLTVFPQVAYMVLGQ